MDSFQSIVDVIDLGMRASDFQKITISNPFNKGELIFKIRILPKHGKDKEIFFQFEKFYGNKVMHENVNSVEDAVKLTISILKQGYKQCDIFFNLKNIKILINKNLTCKIIRSEAYTSEIPNTLQLSGHNRAKNHIFKDGQPLNFLIKLGIMDLNGKVYSHMQKKFRQINRFLELVEDIVCYIPNNPMIIDFGCGKSYLTFALYYYLINMGANPKIIGLDLKQDIIDFCSQLAKDFGFDGMYFYSADLKDFNASFSSEFGKIEKINLCVSLHACDTATDFALYNAVMLKADVVMSVPCCQHELNNQIKNDALNLLLKHGILKERFSSLLTDAVRAEILEVFGYKSQVIEFVDMEHSAKNMMIRAVLDKNAPPPNQKTMQELSLFLKEYNIMPKLFELLKHVL